MPATTKRRKPALPVLPFASVQDAAIADGVAWMYEDREPVVHLMLTDGDIRALFNTLDEVHNLRAFARDRENRPMTTVFESHLRAALAPYR